MADTTQTTLPEDPNKPGNRWCELCSQSLTEGRVKAHLASKKHALKAAGGAKAAAPKASAGKKPATKAAGKAKAAAKAPALDDDDIDELYDDVVGDLDSADDSVSDDDAPPPRGAKEALPADPKNPKNSWCGLCQVSLTPKKAEQHLATARHKANEKKALTAAMQKVRISDQ